MPLNDCVCGKQVLNVVVFEVLKSVTVCGGGYDLLGCNAT
jgi:hypothetical protein